MKYSRSRFLLFLFLIPLILIGCEGDTGPAGPAGVDGTDGIDGVDGTDLNENCTQCHVSSTTIISRRQQFAISGHGTAYTRDTGLCVNCHSHQGFLDRVATGVWAEPEAPLADVAVMNCRTCHQIHSTYTDDDYAFTRSGAVIFEVAGE